MVKRGPLVYCLESMDIEGGHKIDNVLIPADIRLTPKKIIIEGSPIVALDGTARLVDEVSWKDTLYREVGKADKPVNIRLIPYYAWGNRGKAEMTVWMPVSYTHLEVEKNVITGIITRNKGHISSGVIGMNWMMRELTRMGRGDVAFLLASNKTYPSYGYMIEKGATAIWELWNGDTANRWMNSCNRCV